MAFRTVRTLPLLWIAALGAQAPPPPVATDAPTLVVLLRHPRSLDVDTLRERLARGPGGSAGDPAPSVESTAEGVRGQCHGFAWTVRSERGKYALGEDALDHLATLARHRLARHRAHLLITAGPAADGAGAADRRGAYRALAAVATALLDEDCVGIALLDHGRFDVVDAKARKRLGADDPLAAFAGEAPPSVVVLLREAFRLDEERLRAAVKRGFDVDLPARQGEAQAEGESENFVAAQDPIAMVRVDGALLMLTMRPGRALQPEDGQELRLRKALADHTAMLHIALMDAGGSEDGDEPGRMRALARLVAGLWDENCLALSWSSDPRIVAASDELPAHLRATDPVAATLGNAPVPVIDSPEGDEEMAAAIAEARRRFGEAERHLRGGGSIHVKFPFPTRSGGHEHIWIAVHTVENGIVRGVLDNEPIDVEGLRAGSEVERKLAELTDWLYEEDGQLRGHFSGKVLERRLRQQQEQGGGERRGTGGTKR